MKDKFGRAYAKVSDVKEGDRLEVDGDFTCMKNGSVYTVCKDESGLFVLCKAGGHYLDGQIEGVGVEAFYMGLYPARAA